MLRGKSGILLPGSEIWNSAGLPAAPAAAQRPLPRCADRAAEVVALPLPLALLPVPPRIRAGDPGMAAAAAAAAGVGTLVACPGAFMPTPAAELAPAPAPAPVPTPSAEASTVESRRMSNPSKCSRVWHSSLHTSPRVERALIPPVPLARLMAAARKTVKARGSFAFARG